MRRVNAATVLVTTAILLGGTLGVLPATAAPVHLGKRLPEPVATVTKTLPGTTTTSRPKPAPGHYTPQTGVRYNNPLGDKAARRRILNHLIKTINSVPGRQKIRIASWNFRSDDLADALIRAHNRGVSVRVVIDRLNANDENPNPPFVRLTRALRQHQANRRPSMRSYTRRCVSSCRAGSGIAHVKFFLFSRVAKARDVVMYGSNNATDLAAYGQWNDLYTLNNHSTMYDEFEHVFNQMVRDQGVRQPYLSYHHGKYTSYFYPYRGAGTTKDPLLTELGRIVCSGATGGTGTDGHTKIRIAQTSMHGERGKAIAGRLRQMWERGCDIKIVYAVFGNEVLQILRHTDRGPVPIKQIAQDHNLDGVYDRYLHMKTMAVSGVYGSDTSSNVTWNGSANWTSVALASDEVVMRIFDPQVRQTYSAWFDYLFAHPPVFSGKQAVTARSARQSAVARGIDPYSQMQLD